MGGKISGYSYGPDWQVVKKVTVKAGETQVHDFTLPPPPPR
jgi:hypothetical protein